MKKIIALLLSLVIVVCLAACNGGGNAPSADEGGVRQLSADGKLFDDSVTLDICIGSHPSWPYRDDFKAWQYIREAVGGNIKVRSIPSSEYATKVSLMMASPETLPDLLHVTSKDVIDSYALSGAFYSVEDNIELLPNYKALWDAVPDEERVNSLRLRLSGDGKTYFPQVYDTDSMQSYQCWMYREDIFAKNGLQPPTTFDELYEVCKKLKAAYPDSYPLSMCNYNILATIGPEFKADFQHYVYYSFAEDKWHYGAAEQTMYDMISFLIKMRDEELIAPDFLDMKTKAWEELCSTDRGFIMPSYVARIDSFNLVNRVSNPDFTWKAMMPPKANTPDGQNKIAHVNADQSGYAVCHTGRGDNYKNAFKFIDWMYTDEATELLSWGKEGETYSVVDGKRKYILDEGETGPYGKYGLLTYGTYQRIDPVAGYEFGTDERNAAIEISRKYQDEHINPKHWMAFSDEELTRREELRPAIENYTDEMISKFILKMVPLTEWDSFVANLHELGMEELLEIHESAYNRVKDTIQ